jgi:catechol 2,3-dioxygenase
MMAPWGLPAQKKWFTQATPFAGAAQIEPSTAPNPITLERYLAEPGR